MRIRGENGASVSDRLRGRNDMHPVTFIDWLVLEFAFAASIRPLAPALNRPPIQVTT